MQAVRWGFPCLWTRLPAWQRRARTLCCCCRLPCGWPAHSGSCPGILGPCRPCSLLLASWQGCKLPAPRTPAPGASPEPCMWKACLRHVLCLSQNTCSSRVRHGRAHMQHAQSAGRSSVTQTSTGQSSPSSCSSWRLVPAERAGCAMHAPCCPAPLKTPAPPVTGSVLPAEQRAEQAMQDSCAAPQLCAESMAAAGGSRPQPWPCELFWMPCSPAGRSGACHPVPGTVGIPSSQRQAQG